MAQTVEPADRPKSDTPTPSSKRGSIPMLFQGDASEINSEPATARPISNAVSEPPVFTFKTYDNVGGPNLTARVMEELRIKSPAEGPVKAPGQGGLPPAQSSSQLTDILNGVSPSRADFRGYDSSSAVPSPLHRAPQGAVDVQQPGASAPMLNSGQAPAAFPGTPLPPPPMALHDHFYMTNEHIDMVAMSLYDWVQAGNNQTIKAASSKHEQLKTTVEQRFDDIKSQINSVGEKADHNGNQSHNLSVQLDSLRDYIKAEVVEPLATQAQKVNGMEQGIKDLQKAMQDLQNSVAKSQASPFNYPSPPQVCRLSVLYPLHVTDLESRYRLTSMRGRSHLTQGCTIRMPRPPAPSLQCPLAQHLASGDTETILN